MNAGTTSGGQPLVNLEVLLGHRPAYLLASNRSSGICCGSAPRMNGLAGARG